MLRQWERGHALPTVSTGVQDGGEKEGEEGEGKRQEKKASPLFDDFSDDETFQYVSDSEPAARQWGRDGSPPAGPRTPSTTPPYSPESISSSGEGAVAEVHTPVTPTEPEGKSGAALSTWCKMATCRARDDCATCLQMSSPKTALVSS